MKTKLMAIWPVLLAAIAILAARPAAAEDWPQWRGPQQDGISKETGLLKQWPAEGPKVLWQKPLGAGFACMSVAGGHIFTQLQIPEGQFVVALDDKTGNELWRVRVGDPYQGDGFPGPRSQPTVDGTHLYVTGSTGQVLCLDTATSKTLWQINVFEKFGGKLAMWGLADSPLVEGDRLYVYAGNSLGAAVVALNKNNGEVIWKSGDESATFSSPMRAKIAGAETLVVFSNMSLLGFAPDTGKPLWSFPWPTKPEINVAQPIVAGDNIFIGSGYNHGCALVHIDLATSPSAKQVYANKLMRAHFNTPVLVDGYVYGFDDSTLRCLKLDDGTSKWENKDFGKGSLTVADGLAYILGEKGNVALAKLTPEKLEIISEAKDMMSKERCWTSPVVANGRLYLRDQENIKCLDVKGQ